MKQNKIKVYSLDIGKKVIVKEIDNTLESFQKEVGGYIEIVSLDVAGELDLVCNEEGKIKALPLNRAWIHDSEIIEMIAGNCFIARHDAEGNCDSIKESDIDEIEQTLKRILGIQNNTVILAQEEIYENSK